MADGLVDRLLPSRCVLCHGPGDRRGFDLCRDCQRDLPWNTTPCPRCGRPSSTDATGDRAAPCVDCHGRELPFVRCVAPFVYEFPLTGMVQALKYDGALVQARVLGTLLADGIARTGPQPEIVVPMPLHVTRLLERGYNQSHELARWVACRLDLRVDPRALRRVRATQPQVGLDRAARRRNVHDAFVADAARVDGRHVALLDDVVTTASTVAAAAFALRAAGARRIDVWCVARAL